MGWFVLNRARALKALDEKLAKLATAHTDSGVGIAPASAL